MPPFKLEAATHMKSKERRQRIVFTKASYNTKVKMSDWEKYRESEPIDNDPYCPGSLNYMLSHYKRLGFQPNEEYITTTRIMLEQINDKDKMLRESPNKRLVNYYTYNDNIDCKPQLSDGTCPKICAERYISTMQNSYRPPYFYKMQRVALPITPFLKYRKFKVEEPHLSDYKFYDEGFHAKSMCLAKHKSAKWISFNPLTGLYTNGMAPDDGAGKCVVLDYDKFFD